ncbi:hypothetical protein AOE57_01280 [Candidatus Riesia pediculicola]|nr:hypothetical protein AOE57_01280 [Candidatus Riesia pediculicola]
MKPITFHFSIKNFTKYISLNLNFKNITKLYKKPFKYNSQYLMYRNCMDFLFIHNESKKSISCKNRKRKIFYRNITE